MPNNGIPVPRCPEFNSTYQKGCRCDFCREQCRIRRTRERLRSIERSRGLKSPTDRLPVEDTRELISRAFSNGASDTELETLLGIRRVAVQKIRLGKTKYVTRDTRDRVRRVLTDNEDLRAPGAYTRVPADWTRAMVYGLCAQGWTMDQLDSILRQSKGMSGRFLRSITAHRNPNVYYKHQQAVAWLVQQIGDARGPSVRVAKWAAREGYFPCKHYDYNGKLKVSSLPESMRQAIEGV